MIIVVPRRYDLGGRRWDPQRVNSILMLIKVGSINIFVASSPPSFLCASGKAEPASSGDFLRVVGALKTPPL